ncbi:MAG: chorismate-binding protein [Coprobacter sp.]|nr:chorismate-binding protein [Coprobacter sp.]
MRIPPSLQEAIEICIDRAVPFFACRRPDEADVAFGAQLWGDVLTTAPLSDCARREGFLLHPFDTKVLPMTFISPQITLDKPDGWNDILSRPSMPLPTCALPRSSQEMYMSQADRVITALQRGDLRKVVLSRVSSVPCSPQERVADWFDRLTILYPQAFVFLVYIPGVTLWAGASPELFLQRRDDGWRTYSLAATKPVTDTTPWGDKEIEEQQIVTDYIHDVIHRTTGIEPHVSPLCERVAGRVKHLCTTLFLPTSCDDGVIDALVARMHPTPAVGGFPRDEALSFIADVELHDRRYYTGYVGYFSGTDHYDLFVNLRSMELSHGRADLYVGGGLTARSVAGDEWRETCIKSSTMLDIINSQKQ